MFFLFKWISDLVHTFKVKIGPVIVSILQLIKGAEDSGILGGIASLVDDLTKGHLGTEVNDLIKANVTKGIATFLAIDGLPANATPDQIKKFEDDVVTALAGKAAADSITGKSYTDLGAEIYKIIQDTINDAKITGVAPTYAVIATKIEEAYQDYLKAKAQAEADAATQDQTQA